MFEPLPGKFDFPESERKVLEFWERERVFERSLELRADAPRFVFYEGPPTANGLPHPGHCLTRAMKDIFPRYKTMCGHLVERKAGWDTHGLPVEVEVCKELGIHSKDEIEAYGVEKFVHKCIESVFRYTQQWEEMTRRLGFWVNLDDAYVTYHQSYVESVWWGLKTLFERGLLYQGHKVVWWWCQGGTALSAGEVGEGYREVDDPSVFIRFPLVWDATAEQKVGSMGLRPVREDSSPPSATPVGATHGPEAHAPRVSLLVWTTTPWTLISNHFAAVGPDIDYSLVHDKTTGEYLYIATALVDTVAGKVKHELEEVATCKGTDLLGLRYVPPFGCFYHHKRAKGGGVHITVESLALLDRALVCDEDHSAGEAAAPLKAGGKAHIGWRVLSADFVTLDSGSGIVHEAPAFGEVDFDLLQQERDNFLEPLHLPLICAVASDGTFDEGAPTPYRGRWIKECDKEIVRELKDRGILYHQEVVRHPYPFCPRAENDPLIQYARKSWFVRTSQFKDEFLANNAKINWLPDHIQEGRFGDFLRNNVDWALSRERYWGTPLPIWRCEKCGKTEAIGSFDELRGKDGATDGGFWEQKVAEHEAAGDPPLPDHLRVHKPYIDEWTFECAQCRGTGNGERGTGTAANPPARMRRVPEVIDCWWDAGSMPFAQWGFPHVEGSTETFIRRFPADFISEAIDQTRGWFYGLLAISTMLFRDDLGSMGLWPVRQRPSLASSPRPTLQTSQDLSKRRRILPHWEAGGSTYFLTFRVFAGELSTAERTLVLDACRHWDGERLLLHAVVVMPDHVHLLCTPLEVEPGVWWSVADLMHGIKGYTATQLNKRRGQTGPFWQQEYYDRIIRNESDFNEKWGYIVTNPERRGLPEDYAWVWVEPSHEPDGDRQADAHGPEAHAPLASSAHASSQGTTPSADYPMPYRTCIVLGHMMGEDGLKMSKRTKNYKEPGYIFDKYGADAMRWYFFSAQAPWTTARFEEANIRDAHREFLVRLYNVFSFFNIYARIDGFIAHPQHGSPWRPTAERGELDRWIISELFRTTAFVREKMDAFENYPAAGRLNEFVDALSNWYVRRSRERFWRSDKDQDKWDAYHTLYGVLLTLSKLIAPFTPFFAETMYQNLQGTGNGERGTGESALPASVHLCDYPQTDEALIDERLATEMELVRELVSLGRASRTSAKLKVRQPLALVEIILARHEHEGWLQRHSDLIAEELNIKQVEFSTEADHYVTYQAKPNFKALGPRFGKLAPQVAAALKTIDAADARKTLVTTGELPLHVAGVDVRLTRDDLDIRLEAREGWSAAQGRAGVVVVKTELTQELKDEGLVRELIHHVQSLRKTRDLPYEARITLYIESDEAFVEVVRRFEQTLRKECLAEQIVFNRPPDGETESHRIEGHEVSLAIHT